jgi:hypothetical protein
MFAGLQAAQPVNLHGPAAHHREPGSEVLVVASDPAVDGRETAEQFAGRISNRAGREEIRHLAAVDRYRVNLFSADELEEGRLGDDGDPPAIPPAQTEEAGQQT